MLEKIITIKQRVIYLLRTQPQLRESDDRLMATIWRQDCHNLGYKMETMAAYDLLKLIAEGKVTSHSAATRQWRRLQETHPELQGTNYQKRQRKAGKIKYSVPVM